MERTAESDALIELIYEACVDGAAWPAVVEGVSEAFGGAAVALGLQLPGHGSPMQTYRAKLNHSFAPVFAKHFLMGTLPWGSLLQPSFCERFARASEVFPDEDLPGTGFYLDWMRPQGLTPQGPVAHTIAVADGRAIAGMAIYRLVGGRAFDDDDIAFGDAIAPHLRRAYALAVRFGSVLQRTNAFAEVIDRLPTGVVLLNAELEPVTCNRTAERIAAERDGFRLEEDGPHADDACDERALREAIRQALVGVTKVGAANVLAIRRPSGRADYTLLAQPLLGTPRREEDAAVVVFVGDPEAGIAQVSTTEILRSLYSLTQAEADLVCLLVRGRSLDEAALERGVTRNTARTQLKQVFAKTGTKRQGELVRLVLSGVAGIRDD